MNGGSISGNTVYNTTAAYIGTLMMGFRRGTLYAQDSNVYLNNVTFNNNVAKNISIDGLVAYFLKSAKKSKNFQNSFKNPDICNAFVTPHVLW